MQPPFITRKVRMKKILIVLIGVLTLLFLHGLIVGENAATAAKAAKPAASAKQASCKSCHSDFSAVLPKSHPAVKGTELGSCTSCHKPDFSGKAAKNAFSTRMHMAHLGEKAKLDCAACHTWTPGKAFGLKGVKGSWGAVSKEDMKLLKETFESWGKSQNMDNLHAKGNIVCMGCHGKDIPKPDSTVENQRCLECHGPLDKLAKKTEPKDFADRNPHKSHLGDIACTVCHKGHQESKVYCLDCHKNFKMSLQGAKK